MNNKGFTLVELLATVVIISVVITLVSISVSPIIKNYEENLSKTQISIIEEAANIYYLKEGIKNEYEDSSFEMCVNLSYLIENDYLEKEEVLNPKDYEKLDGSVKITYKSDQLIYKYNENNCTYKYQSFDKMCTLVNDMEPLGISIGDKYQCKVKDDMETGFKDGYYFYVLSFDDNKTANLIMERNIYYDEINDVGLVATETNMGLIAWYSNTKDNKYGPVIAMNYLHNATKDWDNIPNVIMDYDDENISYSTQQKGTNGYGGIKTTENTTIITSIEGEETGRIENLKARMPRYDEVHGTGKCLTYIENENKYGSCPVWLANYFHNSSFFVGEGLKNINDIYGYWTLSSFADSSDSAWIVGYYGYVSDVTVDSRNTRGVRPVISLPRNQIQIKKPI